MVYGYLYSASHRKQFRGALSVTGRKGIVQVNRTVLKLRRDGGDIPLASHSGVQEEEGHSRVQDPLQQIPGSGIEKYGTKVQADHSDQQSVADEKIEQIAV